MSGLPRPHDIDWHTARWLAGALLLLLLMLLVPRDASAQVGPVDRTEYYEGVIEVHAYSTTSTSRWDEYATYTVDGRNVTWKATTDGESSFGGCKDTDNGTGSGSEGWWFLEFGEPAADGSTNMNRYQIGADSDEKYEVTHEACVNSTQFDYPPRTYTNDPQSGPFWEDIGDTAEFWRDSPDGSCPASLSGEVSRNTDGSTNHVTWNLTRKGVDCKDQQCANGRDDDGDGLKDHPEDPGCSEPDDDSETGTNACDNGKDDDNDGRIDWRANPQAGPVGPGSALFGDPDCDSLTDNTEGPDCVTPSAHFGARTVTGNEEAFNGSTSSTGFPTRISKYEWDFGDGTTGEGLTPRHTYSRPGEYDVSLKVTNDCGESDTKRSTVAVDPVKTYAPAVYMHPKERFFPGSASSFIRRSRLVWDRPDKKLPGCANSTMVSEGSVKPTRLSGRGASPYSHLKSWVSWQTPEGYTRRSPQRCVDGPTVRRSNGLPKEVAKAPRGGMNDGFVLDLADTYSARAGDQTLNAPVYTEYAPGRYIIYWFFSPYNHWSALGANEVHEGDWERIVVRLDARDRMLATAYARHYCAMKSEPRSEVRFLGDPSTRGTTHPVVYSALGGHASYPTTGTQRFDCKVWKGGIYDKTAKGRLWKTWSNVRKAVAEPWYGFGGNWGTRGRAPRCLCNFGPPGPSASKLSEAVPSGW